MVLFPQLGGRPWEEADVRWSCFLFMPKHQGRILLACQLHIMEGRCSTSGDHLISNPSAAGQVEMVMKRIERLFVCG